MADFLRPGRQFTPAPSGDACFGTPDRRKAIDDWARQITAQWCCGLSLDRAGFARHSSNLLCPKHNFRFRINLGKSMARRGRDRGRNVLNLNANFTFLLFLELFQTARQSI